jgi:hypothetical protein
MNATELLNSRWTTNTPLAWCSSLSCMNWPLLAYVWHYSLSHASMLWMHPSLSKISHGTIGFSLVSLSSVKLRLEL